jgi:uncharacterized membrane protein
VTIAAELIPEWLSVAAWLTLCATCGFAAAHADWAALRAVPQRYHLLFGGTLCCVVLWLLSVTVIKGLWLHLLGMTCLTLVLGWRFAILAGTASVLIHTLLIRQPLAAAPVAWLLTVALPATVSRYLLYRLQRAGGSNLFVYVLGAGFAGGVLCVLTLAPVALGVLWLCGQQAMVAAALDNWPLLTLMLFPEGFINGMIVTTLAVFHPELVKTLGEIE